MQNVLIFLLVSSDYCRLLQGTEDKPSKAGLLKPSNLSPRKGVMTT